MLIPIHILQKNVLEIEIQYITHDSYNAIQEPHQHTYYEIFVFKKAKGIHYIDFEQHIISDNSIHCISENQVHYIDREKEAEGYVISFTKEFYYFIFGQENLYNYAFFHTKDNTIIENIPPILVQELIQLMLVIDKEIQQNLAYSKQIVVSYLHAFLYKCLHIYYKNSTNSRIESSITKQFIQHLEKNYVTQKQVSTYADYLAITPRKLNDTLLKDTGVKASNHIANRVVLEAKRLFYYKELNVKEIGYALGFEDPSHFSKFIKLQTGLSPQELKQNIVS